MNRTTKALVDELRNDSDLKKRFNMNFFITQSWCGTVGCIAGHVLMKKGRFDINNQTSSRETSYLFNDEVISIDELIKLASFYMDIPVSVGYHLFVPGKWTNDLTNNIFDERYKRLWKKHPNWRCDLDTIEKMKEWAITHPFRSHDITPETAADVIEHCVDIHPGYVDWQEFERVSK